MSGALQRILVLGADGFIGRRVLDALAASDWALPIGAGRRALKPGRSDGPQRILLDATDATAVQAQLGACHGVVNCVAGSADTIVASARALFGTITDGAPRPRIVHLSTMSVYGSAVGAIEESAPLRGDLGAYSSAKVEAERYAAAYGNAVILRPGCVYGPGSPQWSGRIARWLQSGRVGDLGAAGDGLCNLVHVDDVVNAIVLALRTPGLEGQAFNLSTPTPPTWNEYFVRFGKALGATPVRRITRRRLKLETKLLAPPLKIAELLAQRARLRTDPLPPPMPPSLLPLWRQEIRLQVGKAEQWLGLRFKPVEEGLVETAAWYRQAGIGGR